MTRHSYRKRKTVFQAIRNLAKNLLEPLVGLLRNDVDGLGESADEMNLQAIVVMPDLPGMGEIDKANYHPYCQRESLAYASLDMVSEVIAQIEDRKGGFLPANVTWNGKVYNVYPDRD